MTSAPASRPAHSPISRSTFVGVGAYMATGAMFAPISLGPALGVYTMASGTRLKIVTFPTEHFVRATWSSESAMTASVISPPALRSRKRSLPLVEPCATSRSTWTSRAVRRRHRSPPTGHQAVPHRQVGDRAEALKGPANSTRGLPLLVTDSTTCPCDQDASTGHIIGRLNAADPELARRSGASAAPGSPSANSTAPVARSETAVNIAERNDRATCASSLQAVRAAGRSPTESMTSM
jgi:hypothetical protein